MATDDREEDRGKSGRSAWGDPRFWVSVLAIVISLGITILSVIASLLFSINAKLEAQTLANNSAVKDIEYLKREDAERKEADRLRDTYITNARERIIALENAEKQRLAASGREK